MALLDSIPGVGEHVAHTIVAEIGVDMARFPSDGHLASWAGMSPGNNESAGKRKSGQTTKGSPYLRTALIEAAWAASHTKSNLGVQYYRLARCRGGRATVAVSTSILVVIYHLLKDGTNYPELGHDYFDRRDTTQLNRRLFGRLEALGLRVTVKPLPQAA